MPGDEDPTIETRDGAGPMSTFGALPTMTDLDRLQHDLDRIDSVLADLDRVDRQLEV